MTRLGTMMVGKRSRFHSAGLAMAVLAGLFASALSAAAPASAADPAVVYMSQVGRELLAATRSQSPSMIAQVIQKHGDVAHIALSALGNYRQRLSEAEKPEYIAGTARFMARYAASKAPDYQVAKVEWNNESVRGGRGTFVDSTVTLRDGSSYDVRWLVRKVGSSYKVRDATVLGFWMTEQMQTMFESYVSQNGGKVSALTAVLNR